MTIFYQKISKIYEHFIEIIEIKLAFSKTTVKKLTNSANNIFSFL